MICPYCEVEITVSAMDAEDGHCPECGSIIAASSIFQDEDEDEENTDELDDEDF